MPINDSRVTVADYLAIWLRDVVAVRNRPRTAESYATIVNNHLIPKIGALRLSRLQPADVERMEAELLKSGLSSNTVHHIHVVLTKSLKDAMRKGLVYRNVCQLVDPPRPGRYEVTVPEIGAIGQILALALETPYGSLFRFMGYTSVRRREACSS